MSITFLGGAFMQIAIQSSNLKLEGVAQVKAKGQKRESIDISSLTKSDVEKHIESLEKRKEKLIKHKEKIQANEKYSIEQKKELLDDNDNKIKEIEEEIAKIRYEESQKKIKEEEEKLKKMQEEKVSNEREDLTKEEKESVAIKELTEYTAKIQNSIKKVGNLKAIKANLEREALYARDSVNFQEKTMGSALPDSQKTLSKLEEKIESLDVSINEGIGSVFQKVNEENKSRKEKVENKEDKQEDNQDDRINEEDQ